MPALSNQANSWYTSAGRGRQQGVAMTNRSARSAGSAGRSSDGFSRVLAVLAAVTAVLVGLDVGGPARVTCAAICFVLVPGWMLRRWLPVTDAAARFALTIIVSIVVETLAALIMVETGFWHPRTFGVVLFAAGGIGPAAGWLSRTWTNRPEGTCHSLPGSGPPRPVRQIQGNAVPVSVRAQLARAWRRRTRPAGLRTGPLVVASAPWFALIVAVVLWLAALQRTQVGQLGEWGLIPAFPVIWYIAVAIVLALTVAELVSGRVSDVRMTAYIAALVVFVYASPAAVEAVPRLPWVYKHIAVTSYIGSHGHVEVAIDIYQRWPGFFALSAQLDAIVGKDGPLSYAAWAEPTFALANVALVALIARSISRNGRWYWTAALLFTLENWVAGTYYSPQAFAFVLFLAICLVVVSALRGQPRRLALAGERFLTRISMASPSSHPSGAVSWETSPPRHRAVAIAGVLVTFAVVVASHQLTPYLAVADLLPLFVVGYFRPVWVVLMMAVITGLYLLPNLHFVVQHYGLFSSFDPAANATYAPAQGTKSAASIWQERGWFVLSGLTWLFALIGLVRRLRCGDSRWPLLIAWLSFAPALSLVVQSYGGEGRLRALLFTAPFAAMAGAWMLWPEQPEQPEQPVQAVPQVRLLMPARRSVACGVVVVVLAAIFVPTYFQPEADDQISASDVAASTWLDGRVASGDVVISAAPTFPALIGPHYNLIVNSTASLSDYKQYYPHDMTAQDAVEIARSVEDGRVHHAFFVFSTSQIRYDYRHGFFAPGELIGLEHQMERDTRFTRIYDAQTTQIFELG